MELLDESEMHDVEKENLQMELTEMKRQLIEMKGGLQSEGINKYI